MARRYSEEEKERGMVALVLHDGNSRRAEADLEAAGFNIPASTLQGWKRTRADEIDRVAHELGPQMREARARALDDLAHAAMEVTKEGLNELSGKMGTLEPRDLPGAIRNTATTAAIATDKSAQLRGEPTSRVKVDITTAIAKLQRKGLIVDGEAVEIKEIES